MAIDLSTIQPTGATDSRWKLTFHDEFSGTKLNLKKWRTEYHFGRKHNTDNYYAEDAFQVKGGILDIVARRQKVEEYDYTSGVITSLGTFAQTYGWFEIRCQMPRGQGFWPAFWLIPADKSWPPEVDVMEWLGKEPTKAYMTLHYRDEKGERQILGRGYSGPDFASDFHVFAADWREDSITFYIDGVERYRVDKGIPKVPMYPVANLGVGGDWGGMPDATTQFPARYRIDYIRVFARRPA